MEVYSILFQKIKKYVNLHDKDVKNFYKTQTVYFVSHDFPILNLKKIFDSVISVQKQKASHRSSKLHTVMMLNIRVNGVLQLGRLF